MKLVKSLCKQMDQYVHYIQRCLIIYNKAANLINKASRVDSHGQT